MQTANNIVPRLIFSAALLWAIGGCAVYTPGPGYYASSGAYVYTAPPVYVAPPMYANPWYFGPPALFDFRFSSGHYRGHHGWHGGGRGYGGRHYRHRR